MNWRRVWLTVVGLITISLLGMMLGGCGGGGGGVGTGVTGFIVDVTSGLGIGNVVVTLGGKSGTSTTPAGRFVISGVAPGEYGLVVHPGVMFVAVPGPAPRVTVPYNGQTEVGTVLVIDPALLPPAP